MCIKICECLTCLRSQVSGIHTGRTGEIICLLRLTQIGLDAQIVNIGTSDILVIDNGRAWRVQVKSSQIKGNKGKDHRRLQGYQFCVSKGGNNKQHLTHQDCDIVALVAVPQERAIFAPVEHFNGIKTKRLSEKDFTQENIEHATWAACMDWYRNNR